MLSIIQGYRCFQKNKDPVILSDLLRANSKAPSRDNDIEKLFNLPDLPIDLINKNPNPVTGLVLKYFN